MLPRLLKYHSEMHEWQRFCICAPSLFCLSLAQNPMVNQKKDRSNTCNTSNAPNEHSGPTAATKQWSSMSHTCVQSVKHNV